MKDTRKWSNILDLSIPWTTLIITLISTTLNIAYTVSSSVLWVHTFVYHIFIHFNIFSSILTNFIHFSFIVHPIYLHSYNVKKIVWPTVYAVFSVVSGVVSLVRDNCVCCRLVGGAWLRYHITRFFFWARPGRLILKQALLFGSMWAVGWVW
jgi:hypothetical protein